MTAGKLTQAQADQMTTDLKARFTDLVNGVRPARGDSGRPRWPARRVPRRSAGFLGLSGPAGERHAHLRNDDGESAALIAR